MKKTPVTLPLSGQKITSKNKKYGVVGCIFHKHAITKHTLIWYQNTHNLIDLQPKKKGYFSVNFIGSFVNLVMSNILDILLLAARLRLTIEFQLQPVVIQHTQFFSTRYITMKYKSE